jgi:uncharacterized membrane protein YozB (DUF420 family)
MQMEVFDAAVSGLLAAVFVLLLVGVYSEKQRENNLNLVKHGIFSASATIVTLISIFVVMIPAFVELTGIAPSAGILQFPVIWLHAILGAVTVGLAAVILVAWVRAPLAELGCAKTWKLMQPALAVWGVTFALGVYLALTN